MKKFLLIGVLLVLGILGIYECCKFPPFWGLLPATQNTPLIPIASSHEKLTWYSVEQKGTYASFHIVFSNLREMPVPIRVEMKDERGITFFDKLIEIGKGSDSVKMVSGGRDICREVLDNANNRQGLISDYMILRVPFPSDSRKFDIRVSCSSFNVYDAGFWYVCFYS